MRLRVGIVAARAPARPRFVHCRRCARRVRTLAGRPDETRRQTMEFDPVLIAPRRAAMVAQGHWRDRTINDALDDCLARCGDKVALKAVSLDRGTTREFTYRELGALADRIAVGMARLGIGRDDVVSCQLPNGWEFTLVTLACARIGAVMNPLMHIFREREQIG